MAGVRGIRKRCFLGCSYHELYHVAVSRHGICQQFGIGFLDRVRWFQLVLHEENIVVTAPKIGFCGYRESLHGSE